MKLDEAFLDQLQSLDADPEKKFAGTPVAKKLALLLRPAFIARPRKTLVWGDFSNIEARVLPWLAKSPGAEAKLDIFRAVDKDPTVPDVYMRTGATLAGEDVDEMWAAYKDKQHPNHKRANSVRQAYGKVPELSLGFGGAIGALLAMAANYGVYFEHSVAKKLVPDWREDNAWAVDFWGKHGRNASYGIWGAVNSAIENPNTVYEVGRVAYVYDPDYLSGTLFCALPDGCVLTYPSIKWEWREITDKKTGELVDRYQLTFIKGYGRVAAWYGKFAENITQAVAARVLKRTLKRLRHDWHPVNATTRRRYDEWMPVVMHTHDEIVTEPFESEAKPVAEALRGIMTRNDEWDQGLPLAADIATNWWYTKAGV